MSAAAAGWFVAALGVYAGAGLLFAVPFLLWGLPCVDASAHGTGLAFRLMILPGTAALWPVLLRKWWRSAR